MEAKILEIVVSQIKYNGVKDWDKLYNDIQEIIIEQKRKDINKACKILENYLMLHTEGNEIKFIKGFKQKMEE